LKKSRLLVKKNRRKRGSQVRVPEKRLAFIRANDSGLYVLSLLAVAS
jgi:hypothetical protein